MFDCLRSTTIATVLIGLQLFSLKMVYTQVDSSLPTTISSNHSFVNARSNRLQGLDPMIHSFSIFVPKDNGRPKQSRGSGTR